MLLPARSPWRYGFRHALICDAIYDHIPLAERRRLHGRTADAAVGTDVGTDAFLALHYERAGRRAEAHAAALRGAPNASAISSHSEARELYACAIRTAPPDLSPTERGSLFERFATSAAAIDDNEAADVAFRDARRLPGRWRRPRGGGGRRAAGRGPPPARRRARGARRRAPVGLAEIAAPPTVQGARRRTRRPTGSGRGS